MRYYLNRGLTITVTDFLLNFEAYPKFATKMRSSKLIQIFKTSDI
ncbi:hypothetical protein JOD45_000733 [Scopulibacillus daqui]|uniref:Uncharacterized protein n=1 Tax=Scopulibacillus daqui TaxID=1469162 RepID=A0ABS2PWY0_9BACL|nr:hypothetical protein [Scopulibacillus daqui]